MLHTVNPGHLSASYMANQAAERVSGGADNILAH